MDTTAVSKRLESFEGRIPHMYLCTGGKVTIGIGHAMETATDASQLPWSINGRTATPAEIAADYARVAAAAKGQVAGSYASLTNCRMDNSTIDSLASADITAFTGQVAASLPKWNSYPDCVQAALFDMAFNLGLSGLLKFHNLLAACDAGDWEKAASESHRMGIGDARNSATAALFRQALS
jgi:GH24 family phage-related lysozyme (muramidase)